jgi:hypothetical protein
MFWFMPMMLNILGGSVHTIKENAEVLLVASKETGLEVNADKTKYCNFITKVLPHIHLIFTHTVSMGMEYCFPLSTTLCGPSAHIHTLAYPGGRGGSVWVHYCIHSFVFILLIPYSKICIRIWNTSIFHHKTFREK